MKKLDRTLIAKRAPLAEKALVFGEGNFLRAFAVPAVERMNAAGFGGSVVLLQGVEKGLCGLINAQQGIYTVLERGFIGGKVVDSAEVMGCVSRCIDPYSDYEAFLKLSQNPELELVISNTTEFGICFDESEAGTSEGLHRNYPAKLTDFLYRRFRHFGGSAERGLVILPCELIEENGKSLKRFVAEYAKRWGLEKEFLHWLDSANVFADTLVDRIVSGYPRAEAEQICGKLGYEDALLDICEPFFLWVIQADGRKLSRLPLETCGYNIVVTPDLTPYRTRKVRILNGAHTMSVLAGHLCGFETVEQLVNNPLFSAYIRKGIFEEIIPSFAGDRLAEYAEEVLERFKNPFLNHKCLSISLNSVSKFKSRILPTIKDFVRLYGKAPEILSFSFAALIEFYRKGTGSFVQDEPSLIEAMGRCSTVAETMKCTALWGEDLTQIPGFLKAVEKHADSIGKKGVPETARGLIHG